MDFDGINSYGTVKELQDLPIAEGTIAIFFLQSPCLTRIYRENKRKHATRLQAADLAVVVVSFGIYKLNKRHKSDACRWRYRLTDE